MMKRIKKVVSTVAVSAILAAQAVMSAAAAGGSINADVSTKSPVLRVTVPTKMAVAINEFEMGDGSQITSDEFTMKNLSEIPVNVKVTSEATVGADVTLVSTKKAAEDSTDTAKPAMWMAAVAAVADNGGTLEYLKTGTDKTVAGLTGTEENITAFEAKDSKNTVVQNFYLKEATVPVYKGITGTDVTAEMTAATATIGGADFYELTEITTAGTKDATYIATEAATQDVYYSTAAPAAGTPATLTKVAKGTAAGSITLSGTVTNVYSIAAAPTATASLNATKAYLYIDSATAPSSGDAAAFRYIGALSGAKSGWSATSDLTAVSIKYDITGISTSAYTDVAKADGSGLTYGYKKEDSKITLAGDTLTIKIKINDFKDGTLTLADNTTGALNESAGAWGGADDAVTFKFNSTWNQALKGQTFKVTVNLQDGTKIEETLTMPN